LLPGVIPSFSRMSLGMVSCPLLVKVVVILIVAGLGVLGCL
jgi:hypothetical protein